MTDNEKRISENITDLLLETPKEFMVEDKQFFIYPITLGKTYLLAPLYESLEINKELAQTDPTLEMLRTVEEHTDLVCKIIAYHTFDKREDLLNVTKIEKRADFFKTACDISDLTKIIMVAMQPVNIKEMQDYLGITKEHEYIKKCEDAKDKKSSLSFCGKSVFGSLIVPACDKLNLTPRQVIWELSYDLIKMIMSDVVVEEYLSEKERKRVHIPTDRSRINADSKEGMEAIKHMKWE